MSIHCSVMMFQVQRTATLGHQEQQQLDVAAEACSRLEQALGLAQSMDSSFRPLPTRVGAVAEMAEMMTAEMQSMQEQHAAAVALHSLDAEALSASKEQLQRQQVIVKPDLIQQRGEHGLAERPSCLA